MGGGERNLQYIPLNFNDPMGHIINMTAHHKRGVSKSGRLRKRFRKEVVSERGFEKEVVSERGFEKGVVSERGFEKGSPKGVSKRGSSPKGL